ncbi:MAG: DUF2281 domain-containing protein [Magnetococcales bacterium]|nr:DUF2281 domain-containing protein [Magnetococcales bacterium]MBF0165689.1 DUF2281 domain-containing protein [Magnetococcales bacterium]
MTTLDMIASHVARLPEDLQVELLHYALFLEQRIANNKTARQTLEERQRLLAESLESAARLNPFQGIPDPVAWQRDIRQDRPLPDREENSC